MGKRDRFHCVCCARVYVQPGRWDLPRCPHCGAASSLFPEWLDARRRRNRR